VPGLSRDHPDAWTLEVMNAILGDGMSSRLFQSVREEKGLAYDVGSYIVDYADAGSFVITAGVDPAQIAPAIEAILAELALLRDEQVPEDELGLAKAYLGGRLELRMEETRHLASWLGGQEALHDKVLTLEQALEELNAVTAAGINDVARRLIREDMLRLAIVAPPRRGRKLESLLKLPGGAG
jgi:predicted Zn-dependent peptidase